MYIVFHSILLKVHKKLFRTVQKDILSYKLFRTVQKEILLGWKLMSISISVWSFLQTKDKRVRLNFELK